MEPNNAVYKHDASEATLMDHKVGENRNASFDKKESPLFFSKRLFVSFLLFSWNIIIWIIRNNMNVAVVEMTSNKSLVIGNNTILQTPEFHWNSQRIGLVLSLIHCGGLLSFMSGFVISKLGGSMSCAISMLICGITTLLHPASLRYDFYLFLPCRVITGVFQNFYMSSFAEVFSRWIPKNERSKLMTFCYGGLYVGAVLVYPVCGFVANEWGWPMVFYSTGFICTMMAFTCVAFLKNDPSKDRSISKAELSYILEGLEKSSFKKQVTHSYKNVLTSPPIWALCVANIATLCGLTFFLDCLPWYIRGITGKSAMQVGFVSSIPNIVTAIMFMFAGTLVVYWKNNSNITSTRMYKILIGVSFVSQIFLFLVLIRVSNFTMIMVLMVGMRLFTPFNILIVQLIMIEVAPGYTGMVSGLVSFCGSFISIATQTTIGYMTTNHSPEEWNRCFTLIAGLLAVSVVIFTLFGSSEAQPWSLSKNCEEKQNPSETSVKLIGK